MNAITIRCDDTEAIRAVAKKLGAFRAVIEATGTYRWLYANCSERTAPFF